MPEHCDLHEDHSKEFTRLWKFIGTVKTTVDKHSGMWVVVFLILVAALAWVGYAVNRIGDDSNTTAKNTAEIRVTVTAYMAANTERLNELKNRLVRCEEDIKEIRKR